MTHQMGSAPEAQRKITKARGWFQTYAAVFKLF